MSSTLAGKLENTSPWAGVSYFEIRPNTFWKQTIACGSERYLTLKQEPAVQSAEARADLIPPKDPSDAGRRKMPEPIMLPTTSAVTIHMPSLRVAMVSFASLESDPNRLCSAALPIRRAARALRRHHPTSFHRYA